MYGIRQSDLGGIVNLLAGDDATGAIVAIHRLLANAVFDPSKVRVMVEAYDCACRVLDLTGNRNDELTDLVAKKIMEIAQAEVDLDAQFICDRSLQELGITRH